MNRPRLAGARAPGLFAVVLVLLGIAWSRPAAAYPWMIRHEYTACAQCHVDPSGLGPLTSYGRAMGEVVLRTQYGEKPEESGEPGPGAKFLWGIVPLPEALDSGGSFRVMSLTQKVADSELTNRILYMQSDLSATVQVGRFVASGSLGYLPKGGLVSAVTRGGSENLVSRQHWLGFRLDEDATMLVRAGRMNVPFGIRDIQHTLSVRSLTRSDINEAQQHGVAFSYSGEGLRAEVMAILGNYQIRPDAYRERGYSGYAEWAPTTKLALGASSRVTHAELDPLVLVPVFRQAHGLFTRWATPWEPLVLLAEADYVVSSPKHLPRLQGVAAMAQAYFEIIPGLHYQVTGEAGDFGPRGSKPSYAGWLSFAWFLASHVDLRLDGIHQSIASAGGRTMSDTLLVQAHLYL